MRDVRATFPDLPKSLVIDVTRCTAEYIERVIARNHGGRPRRTPTTTTRPSRGARRSLTLPATEPMSCPGCRRDVALVIDRVMIMGTFVAEQPRMGAMQFRRLTCPRCGWRIAVLAMHANGRLTVHELPRRPPEEDVCA
jgi:hypothetical protein